jgi:hypothetical protein
MLVNKMQNMREQMHAGFTAQEAAINKRLDDFALMDQKREECVTALESMALELNKAFMSWKAEVDTSLNSIKLELTKLNSYFDRNMRTSSNPKSGVL